MSNASVSTIIEALGSKAIEDALCVSSHSVRHAKYTGKFPASWYARLSDLCAGKQVECPLSLFNFLQAAVGDEQ
jgi:hypothetical protein